MAALGLVSLSVACGSSGEDARPDPGGSESTGGGGGAPSAPGPADGDIESKHHDGGPGGGTANGGGQTEDGGALDVCSAAATRVVKVSTASQLSQALERAAAGDRIELADGTYSGQFTATASGTASHPIALCGAGASVLSGGNISSGYGFSLKGSHWVLSGFKVTKSGKGIVLDAANHNVMDNLEVYDIGEEGIHFRTFSSDNILRNSHIHDTGRDQPGYGEGVYIGSAYSHWSDYTDGKPDACDRNQIIDNRIENTAAENIDIKEGTTGGLIEGNTLSGKGMSGENYSDSWLDVKGNGYQLKNNTGDTAIADGFQVHQATSGWGNDNVFHGNEMSGVPGYGINVFKDVTGTVVGCDNTMTGGDGLSNEKCNE